MNTCRIYKPREDSTLLERHVKAHAKGYVLDIGTGSGIQAIGAAESGNVKKVLACDVQKGVIDYCRKCIKNPKIRFVQSDLFNNIGANEKFDTIIFNPPYLPEDIRVKDITLDGGKKGYEVIQRFLEQCSGHLKPDGIILIVFSSLTKKEKVDEFISGSLLEHEELEMQHIFFEELYVYKIIKSGVLKELEKKGVKSLQYFAKGHRGLIFKGRHKNKEVMAKIKNPKSAAVKKIENEAKWLKLLNKRRIGPKLLSFSNEFLVYEFIDGDFIREFILKSNKKLINKVIVKIFNQLRVLDGLQADKEEMHHPYKHILIKKRNAPVLIDFERMHNSPRPKNVTQFCQFLISSLLSGELAKKSIKFNKGRIIELAKAYKNAQTTANFKNIINSIQ